MRAGHPARGTKRVDGLREMLARCFRQIKIIQRQGQRSFALVRQRARERGT